MSAKRKIQTETGHFMAFDCSASYILLLFLLDQDDKSGWSGHVIIFDRGNTEPQLNITRASQYEKLD